MRHANQISETSVDTFNSQVQQFGRGHNGNAQKPLDAHEYFRYVLLKPLISSLQEDLHHHRDWRHLYHLNEREHRTPLYSNGSVACRFVLGSSSLSLLSTTFLFLGAPFTSVLPAPV
jgi:hypothetical protein